MDVKRIVACVLLGCALGIGFFVCYFILARDSDDVDDVPVWWRGSSYSGKVTQLSGTRLSLELTTGEFRQFRLDSGTRYFLWTNQPVVPGLAVKVSFREIKASPQPYLLARTIRVLPTQDLGTPQTRFLALAGTVSRSVIWETVPGREAGSSKRRDKVMDLGIEFPAPVRGLNGDDVETAGTLTHVTAHEPFLGDGSQAPLFEPVNGILGRAVGVARSCLDFHEYHNLSVQGYDIQLTFAKASIAIKNAASGALQMLRSGVFAEPCQNLSIGARESVQRMRSPFVPGPLRRVSGVPQRTFAA